MDKLCSKCGAHLASPWSYCPRCGAAIAPETHEPMAAAAEKAPVRGSFSGLLFGVIAAPILLIVGTMLCLTGLGAIAGIPLIIAGILAPLAGPLIGLGALKGKCPWCGAAVTSLNSAEGGFDCHACSKRIAVRDLKFVRAD